MRERKRERAHKEPTSVRDYRGQQDRDARADGGAPAEQTARGATASLLDATIRLPGDEFRDTPEKVVRPALAVLFRIAIGPQADRYVQRFLGFERAGRLSPGWHWPSFFVPGIWAFYRRLWVPGLCFTALPIAGALAFATIESRFERVDFVWVATVLLAVWVLPGVIAALCAHALLYVRVRGLVHGAESGGKGATRACERLAAHDPTSTAAAVGLGGGALVIVAAILVPQFHAAYADIGIRAQVAQALAAARGLQGDIEASWASARLLPRQTDNPALRAQSGAALIDEVDVSPVTGRVRLALGPGVPELSGKTILLSPSRDAQDRVQWLCVPVDIPQRYLPKECRG
jgi:hypothetical protein